MVIEIQSKTASVDDAGFDAFGTINVQLVNLNFETCDIYNLDSEGDNFDEGDLDVFAGEDLQVSELWWCPKSI